MFCYHPSVKIHGWHEISKLTFNLCPYMSIVNHVLHKKVQTVRYFAYLWYLKYPWVISRYRTAKRVHWTVHCAISGDIWNAHGRFRYHPIWKNWKCSRAIWVQKLNQTSLILLRKSLFFEFPSEIIKSLFSIFYLKLLYNYISVISRN